MGPKTRTADLGLDGGFALAAAEFEVQAALRQAYLLLALAAFAS